MAAKRGEDSKQGLIIALVIFVILTLGLGVATYYGFAEQEKLKDAAKAAKKDADAKSASRDWHRFQNALLKVYIGHPLSKEDQDHLSSQWASYENNKLGSEKDDNRADFDKLLKDLNAPGGLGWDPSKKQPLKTYTELVKEKDTQLADLANQLAQGKRGNDSLQTDLGTTKKAADETRTTLQKELDKSNKDKADLVTAYDNKFKEYLATVEKLHNEVDDIKRREDKTKDDSGRQVTKLGQELKDLRIQLENERKKITPPDVVDFEKPKGKVIQIERGGQVVYLNLGSADNVKPELTFSIYGAATSLKGGQRKGALEVTNVLGPHFSKARVTELANANLDPIVHGDLLYNPAWNPSMRQHVAIAGLVDLSGDGRDDTPAFIRGLERLGIVVDAYIDLKDLTIKGKGMNQQTQYLVLGDSPTFNEVGVLNTEDIRTTRKMELGKRMSDLQDEARRLGITVIPFRRFLQIAGYPMPRGISTQDGASTFLDTVGLGKDAPKKEKVEDKSLLPKEK